MKTLATTALILALAPLAAQAQTASPTAPRPGVAAATLPNTMDAPAARATTPATAPAPTQSSPQAVAAAEAALRKTIAAAQAGSLNYADMTDNLAAQVRAQATRITPVIQGFGAVQTVEHRGRENNAELFLVTFANARTQWILGQNPQGKISVLLFRAAED